MPPTREGEAVANTSIAMDVAATPNVGTPVLSRLLALFSRLRDARRARRLAAIDRILRSGLAHID